MGMLDWTEKSADVLQQGGVIGPDERLPWPQTSVMGVQHVIAMFGSTILAPILMGFDPNVAILMSGVGTLIFFLLTGGRVPSYLGSSFAFIAVIMAAMPRVMPDVKLNRLMASGPWRARPRGVRWRCRSGSGGASPPVYCRWSARPALLAKKRLRIETFGMSPSSISPPSISKERLRSRKLRQQFAAFIEARRIYSVMITSHLLQI